MPDEMLAAGTKSAPRRFKGEYDYIATFIRRYEQLSASYNATSSAEKCERIIDYVSRKVERFIESRPSFINKNWALLKADLMNLYDAERKESRYMSKDLQRIGKKWRKRPIRNLETWKKYQREFLTVSGWLLKKKKITEAEEAAAFWNGIPRTLRKIIEGRYLAHHPDVDPTEPIEMYDVDKIAKVEFSRSKFAKNLEDSDSDTDSSDSESEVTSDTKSESEDKSESEEEDRKRKHTKRGVDKSKEKKERKGKLTSKDVDHILESKASTRKSKVPKTVGKGKEKGEVADLIKKMSKMSVEDPVYGVMYYQLITMDPVAVKCVKEPDVQSRPRNRGGWRQDDYGPRNVGNFSGNTGVNLQQGQRQILSRGCFGCGALNHMVRECQPLQELVRAGSAKVDDRFRVYFANGRPVPRIYGQSAVETVKKQLAGSVAINYIEEAYSDIEDDEFDDYIPGMMAVEKTSGKSKEARKAVQEAPSQTAHRIRKGAGKDGAGVWIADYRAPYNNPKARTVPEKWDGLATRAHREPLVGQDINNVYNRPIRKHQQEKQIANPPVPAPIPADVRELWDIVVMRPQEEDVAMKDDTTKGREVTDRRVGRRYNGPHQSEIAKRVNGEEVCKHVLNTPVTLSLQDLLGVSRNVADHIEDMLKKKNVKAVTSAEAAIVDTQDESSYYNSEAETLPLVAPLVAPVGKLKTVLKESLLKEKVPLILVNFVSFGKRIKAIIDSGSQLNIIRKEICD